jgi:hypothetical protein
MFQDGFPRYLLGDVSKVVSLIPHNTYNNIRNAITEETIDYMVDNSLVKIPYRMYYLDVQDDIINSLTEQQKMILYCIYSRCCEGYVRQKNLKSLLMMDYPDWAIPYIVKACDEYVIEILEMSYEILIQQDTERYKRICHENSVSFCKSYNRMISYWNEYYRDRCYSFHQYVGRKLFRECFGYTRSLERRNI